MEFMLNVGHAEYMLDLREVQLTPVWTYEDVERLEGSDEQFGPEFEQRLQEAYKEKTGQEPGDWDLSWQSIYKVDATRDELVKAMTTLLEDLKQDPGGDDGTFDYWPSGVRMAMEVAEHLGEFWPQQVADQAREFILEHRWEFRTELLAAVGLE